MVERTFDVEGDIKSIKRIIPNVTVHVHYPHNTIRQWNGIKAMAHLPTIRTVGRGAIALMPFLCQNVLWG